MNKIDIFKKEFKKGWYVQAGSAAPLFICLAGMSGFIMKKELGYGYSRFIYNAKKGHGEMWYSQPDLKMLWGIIKRKLAKNQDYLEKIKNKYEKIFGGHEKFFVKLEKNNLGGLDDKELLKIFKDCARAMTDSVGLAHILEPIGLLIEKEFEAELAKNIFDKKAFQEARVFLITPKELSFTAREENDLRKIAFQPAEKQEEAIKHHFIKYFWVHNSYAGQKKVSLNYFKKRMPELKTKKTPAVNDSSALKNLVNKYKLSSKSIKLAEIIKFTTIWQDERKANALKTIGYLERILQEISRRTKIPAELFHYLGPSEVARLNSTDDLKALKHDLAKRLNGTYLILRGDGEIIVTGKDFEDLGFYRKELFKRQKNQTNEIRGSIANGGKAVGRAVVCKNVQSINKVKKGDILVASMTRPEYMPALRKAAAIVTDEGGITCHAAIVSRELGIPCIVGTKIATQVLKDGQRVEVDADEGVVIIIN
jgi:phosphoenolpyruvate synthase/pyruvate phosphate dikinase